MPVRPETQRAVQRQGGEVRRRRRHREREAFAAAQGLDEQGAAQAAVLVRRAYGQRLDRDLTGLVVGADADGADEFLVDLDAEVERRRVADLLGGASRGHAGHGAKQGCFLAAGGLEQRLDPQRGAPVGVIERDHHRHHGGDAFEAVGRDGGRRPLMRRAVRCRPTWRQRGRLRAN